MRAIVEKVQEAIDSVTCHVGRWSATGYGRYVMLNWHAPSEQLPNFMYGDEQWIIWGGNQILEKVKRSLKVLESGSETFIDEFGDDSLSSWALLGRRWPHI